MLRILLIAIAVLGLFGVCFFGYFAWQDWALLRRSFANLEILIARNEEFKEIFIAESRQNAHRINVFADGIWTLLSAILAAIGLHGLAILKRAI